MLTLSNMSEFNYSLITPEEPSVSTNTEIKKLDLDSVPWTYRGEGNANIVIGLDNELHVIRLSKSLEGPSHDKSSEFSEDITRRHTERLVREVKNADNIKKQLVGGPGLLGTVQIVEISQEQVGSLNEKLKLIRPKNRLHKEIGFTQGTLHSDLARIHPNGLNRIDYCVEIKLKRGRFDETSKLSQESNLCNFCLHQFLKLKQGKIKHRSSYCPLDLFSGIPERMVLAMASLLQNPQNNLRVFKNGVVIFGEGKADSLSAFATQWSTDFKTDIESQMQAESGDTNVQLHSLDEDGIFKSRYLRQFLYPVCLALMSPINHGEGSTVANSDSTEQLKSFSTKLKTILLDSEYDLLQNGHPKSACDNSDTDKGNISPDCVLSQVLFLQTLSTEEPSSIFEVYKKICPLHACPENMTTVTNGTTASCPSTACFASEVWFDEIKNLSESVLTEDEGCRLQNFLVAATANDCSLMITISSDECVAAGLGDSYQSGDSKNIEETVLHLNDLFADSSRYKVKLGLADMEIKPITCIPKQCIRDCDMLKSFKEVQALISQN